MGQFLRPSWKWSLFTLIGLLGVSLAGYADEAADAKVAQVEDRPESYDGMSFRDQIERLKERRSGFSGDPDDGESGDPEKDDRDYDRDSSKNRRPPSTGNTMTGSASGNPRFGKPKNKIIFKLVDDPTRQESPADSKDQVSKSFEKEEREKNSIE